MKSNEQPAASKKASPFFSDRPVLAVAPVGVMEEMRDKAMAFDLLVRGGFVKKEKAQHALEIARMTR